MRSAISLVAREESAQLVQSKYMMTPALPTHPRNTTDAAVRRGGTFD